MRLLLLGILCASSFSAMADVYRDLDWAKRQLARELDQTLWEGRNKITDAELKALHEKLNNEPFARVTEHYTAEDMKQKAIEKVARDRGYWQHEKDRIVRAKASFANTDAEFEALVDRNIKEYTEQIERIKTQTFKPDYETHTFEPGRAHERHDAINNFLEKRSGKYRMSVAGLDESGKKLFAHFRGRVDADVRNSLHEPRVRGRGKIGKGIAAAAFAGAAALWAATGARGGERLHDDQAEEPQQPAPKSDIIVAPAVTDDAAAPAASAR